MNKGLLLLVGVGAFILLKKKAPGGTQIDLNAEKSWLLTWNNQNGGDQNFASLVSNAFTASELDAVYRFLHDYYSQGKQLTQDIDPALYSAIQTISAKYNIFT